MNSKDNSFTSNRSPANSFDKDELPLEAGVSTLINVIFWRFLSILLASSPVVLLFILAILLADYSQFISAVTLVLIGSIFLLFTISLFRQKGISFDKSLKRLFDISISSLSLPIMAPILFLIALLIKIDSKGPVLYYQKRVGKNGKEFNMLKFRTLISNFDEIRDKLSDINLKSQDEKADKFKVISDPRVTRFGKLLRKTSLDELPQLINVLRGEMSLVGPRPLFIFELDMFNDEYINDYKTVTPGITGFWQVSSINDISYDNRIKLDRYYFTNWSLWLDVLILIKTVTVVLRQTGAY